VKIAFCTPFKPITHASVSGDVTIARDLVDTFRGFGHTVIPVEYFPARGIATSPSRWPAAIRAMRRMTEQARQADCWLTYGSYYKVPDIFGPTVSARLGIPYCLFQASYAKNRGKHLASWPGYALNKRAMLRADHIFCNRVNDLRGCAKLNLPDDRYTHIKPGLPDDLFRRDQTARRQWRQQWHVDTTPVIMTAAMMRYGVKTEGLRWVIESCAELMDAGLDLKLVIAGDGPRRNEIEPLALDRLGTNVTLLGMVDRADLPGVFSAGDIFAFPGLEESVGMVYLEAQQCGLPAVATDDEGAPNVIRHEYSGLITPVSRPAFTKALERLVMDAPLREQLGRQAMASVRKSHNAANNYKRMEQIMEDIALREKI